MPLLQNDVQHKHVSCQTVTWTHGQALLLIGHHYESCTVTAVHPPDCMHQTLKSNAWWSTLSETWMDGWMDGWTDGRTDGRTDGWMDGWMDWMHGRTDGWMDRWMPGQRE